MIIWLASYPRSGNTFMRMILNQCFGIKTSSIYNNDMRMLEFDPALISYIGHFDQQNNHSDAVNIIKTHDHSNDENKAIYIVRDGRSSVISYWHFLQEIEHKNVKIEQIINGSIWPGSWSDHIKSWNPISRKQTLLIRYEDMVSEPLKIIKDVEFFIGIKQISDFNVSFERLHASAPLFFRKGSNENALAEINQHIDLFDIYNGEMMKHMGYY
jgi:hypothetical protein